MPLPSSTFALSSPASINLKWMQLIFEIAWVTLLLMMCELAVTFYNSIL